MTNKTDSAEGTWDEETDLLIAGSGIGGVSAALAARRMGIAALAVEKDATLGGVTAYSAGQLWFGATALAREAGVSDTIQATADYLEHIGAGYGDPELRQVYASEGDRALGFLERVGVRIRPILGLPDYFFPYAPGSTAEGRYFEVEPFRMTELGQLADLITDSPHGLSLVSSSDWVRKSPTDVEVARQAALASNTRANGSGLMAALIRSASDTGVTFRTRQRLVRLVSHEGRIVGGIVRGRDGDYRVRARRGVILAVGGYDWNPDLVLTYEHIPEMGSMAPRTITGDHLAMAGEHGAAIDSYPSWSSPIHVGFKIKSDATGVAYQNLHSGQPNSIIVNSDGTRFGDESFGQALEVAFAHYDGRNRRHINWPAWVIFDHSFYERYLARRGVGTVASDADFPLDSPQSDSIFGLARAAGINEAGLVATVERWNAQCAHGVDEDFHRGEMLWSAVSYGDLTRERPMLGPIDTPPFHAVRLDRVGVGIPSAGLRTNEHAQVIDVRGEPILGLYAVGNSAARRETGAGYQSGIANGRGLLFGIRAAEHAATKL